jgi:hypothetical protein
MKKVFGPTSNEVNKNKILHNEQLCYTNSVTAVYYMKYDFLLIHVPRDVSTDNLLGCIIQFEALLPTPINFNSTRFFRTIQTSRHMTRSSN